MNPGIFNYHNYCYLQILLIIDALIDSSVDCWLTYGFIYQLRVVQVVHKSQSTIVRC